MLIITRQYENLVLIVTVTHTVQSNRFLVRKAAKRLISLSAMKGSYFIMIKCDLTPKFLALNVESIPPANKLFLCAAPQRENLS